MDGISSITTIDQKMAEMRIKNLELLKRHQVCTWICTNYLSGECVKVNGSTRSKENNKNKREGEEGKRTIDIRRLTGLLFLSCTPNVIVMRNERKKKKIWQFYFVSLLFLVKVGICTEQGI